MCRTDPHIVSDAFLSFDEFRLRQAENADQKDHGRRDQGGSELGRRELHLAGTKQKTQSNSRLLWVFEK